MCSSSTGAGPSSGWQQGWMIPQLASKALHHQGTKLDTQGAIHVQVEGVEITIWGLIDKFPSCHLTPVSESACLFDSRDWWLKTFFNQNLGMRHLHQGPRVPFDHPPLPAPSRWCLGSLWDIGRKSILSWLSYTTFGSRWLVPHALGNLPIAGVSLWPSDWRRWEHPWQLTAQSLAQQMYGQKGRGEQAWLLMMPMSHRHWGTSLGWMLSDEAPTESEGLCAFDLVEKTLALQDPPRFCQGPWFDGFVCDSILYRTACGLSPNKTMVLTLMWTTWHQTVSRWQQCYESLFGYRPVARDKANPHLTEMLLLAAKFGHINVWCFVINSFCSFKRTEFEFVWSKPDSRYSMFKYVCVNARYAVATCAPQQVLLLESSTKISSLSKIAVFFGLREVQSLRLPWHKQPPHQVCTRLWTH